MVVAVLRVVLRVGKMGMGMGMEGFWGRGIGGGFDACCLVGSWIGWIGLEWNGKERDKGQGERCSVLALFDIRLLNAP